ncbi:MAG: hypothetical protein JNN05_11870, partial [Candidatus Omnitrophica bacterium]|nr:hypothetical protein [Candidatus Omnitrophota bacterium]
MSQSYRPLRSLAFRLVMLSVVFLLLTVFIVTTVVLYKKFSAIEYELAYEHMRRIEQAFLNVRDALEVKSADWAIWDDTYRYVVDLNPEYVSSNLTVSSFSNLQINFVLLFDQNNNLVHKTSLDWKTKNQESFPDDFLRIFGPESPLLKFDSIDSVRSGVVMSSVGPIILVSRPILNSQAQGPSNGVLVFAKILDQGTLDKMSRSLQLHLSMSPWAEGLNKEITVDVLSKDKMLGRCLIYDVQGKPALILSAEIPRNIIRQAFYSAGWLFILLMCVGLLFFLITYHFIDRKFLRRLEFLTQQTEAVAKDDTGKLTLKLEGNDELSRLVNLINEVVTE